MRHRQSHECDDDDPLGATQPSRDLFGPFLFLRWWRSTPPKRGTVHDPFIIAGARNHPPPPRLHSPAQLVGDNNISFAVANDINDSGVVLVVDEHGGFVDVRRPRQQHQPELPSLPTTTTTTIRWSSRLRDLRGRSELSPPSTEQNHHHHRRRAEGTNRTVTRRVPDAIPEVIAVITNNSQRSSPTGGSSSSPPREEDDPSFLSAASTRAGAAIPAQQGDPSPRRVPPPPPGPQEPPQCTTNNNNNNPPHHLTIMMELCPGEYRPLRSARETIQAIVHNHLQRSECFVCDNTASTIGGGLYHMTNVKYFICPDCRCVNPVAAVPSAVIPGAVAATTSCPPAAAVAAQPHRRHQNHHETTCSSSDGTTTPDDDDDDAIGLAFTLETLEQVRHEQQRPLL